MGSSRRGRFLSVRRGPTQRRLAPYVSLGQGVIINRGSPLNRNTQTKPSKTNTWNFVVSALQSAQFLPAADRKYLKLLNTSANPIYYDFGKPASRSSIPLPAGAEFEFSDNAPGESIHMLALLFSSEVQVLEVLR